MKYQVAILLLLIVLVSASTFLSVPDQLVKPLIIAGLSCAALSLAIAIRYFIAKNELFLTAAVLILNWKLGWICIPYLANNMGNKIGKISQAFFDPKDLYPMLWIGELWRLGVFLYYCFYIYIAIAFISQFIPLAFISQLIIKIDEQKRHGYKTCLSAIFLISAVAVSMLTPRFFEWMMD